MPLATGARIGPYEIAGAIGAGGMGEVYRARDTKLHRDVALKVLPELVANDPERLARFRREAQVLASLNHPNIAHLYGFEDAAGTHALVMEFVPGPTLADRIAEGPLALSEALPIARQIADALEAAHDHGVIHRDLKPANIKIKDDGSVKVLDFGLAKALTADAGSGAADPSSSPTLTARATQMGMILGTAAYMSPEQARGRPVDRRADVWAFGCVLYEMLTGRRAFAGDDVTETLATVLKEPPDWRGLPPELPSAVQRVLRRCLEKDPRKRLSAIGDARLELDEPDEGRAAPQPGAPPRKPVGPLLAAAAAGAVVTAAVAFGLWRMAGTGAPERSETMMRTSMLAPESVVFSPDPADSAISPDGKLVVFVIGSVSGTGDSQLWIRPVNALTAQRLENSRGAYLPFWSPDSRRIGFFADGKLKTIGVDGGRPDVLCDASVGRGGTWNARGDIVFAPAASGGLFRVSANGGDPAPLTMLDTNGKETGHRFPQFLPDGDHFLFAALPVRAGKFNIFVGSLSGAARQLLAPMENVPVFAEPGYLLFLRKGVLVAQRFDPRARTLSGEPAPLGDVPASPTSGANYTAAHAASVSADGTLAYLTEPSINTRLVWTDRTGSEVSAVTLPPGRYLQVSLSPDERLATVVRLNSRTESSIWLVDLMKGGATPLVQATGLNDSVVWSPDGERIVFSSDRDGPQDLFLKDVHGASPEQRVYASPVLFKGASAWSPDGKHVVYYELTAQTNFDLFVLPIGSSEKSRPLLRTTSAELLGSISPDGKWIAYLSDETGRFEVYVQSFPDGGRKVQVTTSGTAGARSSQPVTWWRRDGRQLAVLNADSTRILGMDIEPASDFRISPPKVIATVRPQVITMTWTADLQRAVTIVPESGAAAWSLTFVRPWTAAIRQ
jgi:Tol biopolymer transport system component/tRNA A-37 threonylcarbamoyl transferase component Bud32